MGLLLEKMGQIPYLLHMWHQWVLTTFAVWSFTGSRWWTEDPTLLKKLPAVAVQCSHRVGTYKGCLMHLHSHMLTLVSDCPSLVTIPLTLFLLIVIYLHLVQRVVIFQGKIWNNIYVLVGAWNADCIKKIHFWIKQIPIRSPKGNLLLV